MSAPHDSGSEPVRATPAAPTDAGKQAPWRLATPPLHVEHTRWSKGLIGFYMSCAGVALGATFAAAGPMFFRSTSAMVFGCVLGGISIVTCFFSLAAARRETRSPRRGQ